MGWFSRAKPKSRRPEYPVISFEVRPEGLTVITDWPEMEGLPTEEQMEYGQHLASTMNALASADGEALARLQASITLAGKLHKEEEFSIYVLRLVNAWTSHNAMEKAIVPTPTGPVVPPTQAFTNRGS